MLPYFMDFFQIFVFVCCFAAVLLLFLFFSLSFTFSGENVSSSSKDVAVTRAAVELNIRTIIVLLTLKTICHSWELSVL